MEAGAKEYSLRVAGEGGHTYDVPSGLARGFIPPRVPEKKGLDRRTDGRTDGQQSDPIRVPFFPFETLAYSALYAEFALLVHHHYSTTNGDARHRPQMALRRVPYLKRKKRNPYRITLLSVCPSVRPSVKTLFLRNAWSEWRIDVEPLRQGEREMDKALWVLAENGVLKIETIRPKPKADCSVTGEKKKRSSIYLTSARESDVNLTTAAAHAVATDAVRNEGPRSRRFRPGRGRRLDVAVVGSRAPRARTATLKMQTPLRHSQRGEIKQRELSLNY
ncbi:hypothetical protein EVAR_35817_1 [Eumeta japonica]|uniref:Uncharacterized protein n=1 Tax=Eumeta variegata TaxID=151549 RepID=A0A4C1WXF4_EUMVA|nr:hypothetical protein EVAR_35817_1 [Eumeta japonica]